jgi:hypothetical protein
MLEFRLVEGLDVLAFMAAGYGAQLLALPRAVVLKSEVRADETEHGARFLWWNPTVVWLCNKRIAAAFAAIFPC